MRYYVVIPAYNEGAFVEQMLQSIAAQTLLPARVVLVDDNSTDSTFSIASAFAEEHAWLEVVNTQAENIHLPGSKVIKAFYEGFKHLDDDYDFIVKLDADLVLPSNYFEEIAQAFSKDPNAGMAGGFCYIEQDGQWVLENLTDKDHIRGALKAYRKECFLQIGMLKTAMGWDTADEIISKFYGWKVVTLPHLKVKHMKPTGARYDKEARYKQGEAFYTLGYGFLITAIASAKLALRKKNVMLFTDYLRGFLKAANEGRPKLVNRDQEKFHRSYRWKKIRSKLF